MIGRIQRSQMGGWTRRRLMRSGFREMSIKASMVLGIALSGTIALAQDSAPFEELRKRFQVPEGLEVTIWAESPMLFNPTNIDVDAEGRIWVAEGVNYRGRSGRRPEGDRIVVLEDTDGDGKADSSHTFVQEKVLTAPLGVAVIGNKIVVSQTPDLVVYTDVDGDLRFNPEVDKREVLLSGFNGSNHDHSLHSVTVGPDGQWYWNAGNCGALFTDQSGRTFRIGSPYNPGSMDKMFPPTFNPTEIAGQPSDDGFVYIGGFSARMNPDGTMVQVIGHNYRNSYEHFMTSFGDLFQNDNDDPPACRVTYVMEYGNAGFASADGQRSWGADRRPGQPTAIAEWRQEDPGTMPAGDVYGGGSPTGVVYYENGALGKQYEGLLLSCEAGRNVVFGYQPKLSGAGFELNRTDFLTSNAEGEFAGSDFLGGGRSVNYELKTLFRPSDVAVGADGAIYVSDWFDARVGGHSDLDKTTSGAIYRIAPKGFQPNNPKLDLSSVSGQLAALQSPAVNVRALGAQALVEQGDAVESDVATLLNHDNEYIQARALWVLSRLGPQGLKWVESSLSSCNEKRRIVAFRALRRQWQGTDRHDDFLKMAARMASDESPAVRREVALSMRNESLENAQEILVTIAKGFDGKDRHYLEAIGTGAAKKESGVYQAIAEAMGALDHHGDDWSDAFSWIAWRLGATEAIAGLAQRIQSDSLSLTDRKLALDALAFINCTTSVSAVMDVAANEKHPLRGEAIWWLLNRKNNHWKGYGIDQALREKGIYDPANVELVSMTLPDPVERAPELADAAAILALEGNAERGKAVSARCYLCHRIGSEGIEFGPNLSDYGKTQPTAVVLKAILDPSAEISHGFDGSEVRTKDGLVIHGLVASRGDPVIVKSMGGLTQTVPRDRVESIQKLDRSLMFSPEQLALTAQEIADLVAYLKSDLIE